MIEWVRPPLHLSAFSLCRSGRYTMNGAVCGPTAVTNRPWGTSPSTTRAQSSSAVATTGTSSSGTLRQVRKFQKYSLYYCLSVLKYLNYFFLLFITYRFLGRIEYMNLYLFHRNGFENVLWYKNTIVNIFLFVFIYIYMWRNVRNTLDFFDTFEQASK